MEHEQEHHEKHEQERKRKQAKDRQSQQQFRFLAWGMGFLALGFVLVLTAVLIWYCL